VAVCCDHNNERFEFLKRPEISLLVDRLKKDGVCFIELVICNFNSHAR
jgi:hypothetical protein